MAHSGRGLPSARTPNGHRNIMQTDINEPKEGDYFCVKKDGEDWPIIICDEEVIQTFFTQPPRPESARRADGTWERHYKAGGSSIRDRHFPALNLGTLEFLWAGLRELEPIDLDMGRAIRSSTMNHSLAKAWSEYIGQYKADKISEWKYLDHWKAKLQGQRLERIPTGGMKKDKFSVGKTDGAYKRKGSPRFRYPPGYHNEELDDEEPGDLFLPQDNGVGPKIKQETINSPSSEEMDALYDDADPPYPTSSYSSKRSKLGLAGRFSMRPSAASRSSTGRLASSMPSSARRGTPFEPTSRKIDVNDPDTVIIYVDNPHKMFKVKRRGLDASPLLAKLVTHHPENGWYIMSPMLSSLDADDFQPVGEFIDRREYHPNILDDATAHVRLEGDLSPEMLRYQVARCGTVYRVAQLLEMPGLQDLAARKLVALAPHHQAPEMLTVVELAFERGGPEMRGYLTRHVADHFWGLVSAETERMVEVMSAHRALAEGVFGMLSGRDDEVKVEEAVKEEGHEGVMDRGKGMGGIKRGHVEQSDGEARRDDAYEEKSHRPENEGDVVGAHAEAAKDGEKAKDEGLSQAEKDMLDIALGQSDDEKTGGDWARLVQRQSDLFEAF